MKALIAIIAIAGAGLIALASLETPDLQRPPLAAVTAEADDGLGGMRAKARRDVDLERTAADLNALQARLEAEARN